MKTTTTTNRLAIIEVQHEDAVLNRILIGFVPGEDTGVWLIGGSARAMMTGEPVKDYDFAFANVASLNLFAQHLRSIGGVKVSQTKDLNDRVTCEDYVYRYGPEQHEYAYVQLKREFYHHAHHQFETCDMTLCQFAYRITADYRDLVALEQAVKDVYNKHIRLYRVTGPESTMHRIANHVAKGYKVWSVDGVYGELVRIIRSLPDNQVSAPKHKQYLAGWREKLNIPEI